VRKEISTAKNELEDDSTGRKGKKASGFEIYWRKKREYLKAWDPGGDSPSLALEIEDQKLNK